MRVISERGKFNDLAKWREVNSMAWSNCTCDICIFGIEIRIPESMFKMFAGPQISV